MKAAPWLIGLLAGAALGLFALGLTLAHRGQVSALMMLPQLSHCYETLGAPPGVAVFTAEGYDGHLFYYIARDLGMKTGCAGAYRYQRIFYPALIWALALGQESLMPLAMVVVNLLAGAAGTWLMARWLMEEGHNPWLALAFGLSLGHLLSVQYALAEAVSLALALVGAYLGLRRGRWGWAAAVMALALLTRETVGLMWAPLVAWLAWQRKGKAAGCLALAILPYLGWELVLWARFGELPLFGTNAESLTLFEGLRCLFGELKLDAGLRELLRTGSALPYLGFILFCLGLGLAGLRTEGPWAWIVLAHALAALFLGRGMWTFISSIGRITLTIVPACLFLALRLGRRVRAATVLLLLGLFCLGLGRAYLAGVHDFFIQE